MTSRPNRLTNGPSPCPHCPAIELLDVLHPAYSPCRGFTTRCAGVARWAPESGHVPRGYLGATGRLDDVDLVLLVAEPGDPHEGAVMEPRDERKRLAAETVADTYRCFVEGTDRFHRNVREVVDMALPGMSFATQLSKVWITNTYLCSAPQEGGTVPAAAERFCAETYLRKVLALLPGRPGHRAGWEGSAAGTASRELHSRPGSAPADRVLGSPAGRQSLRRPGLLAGCRGIRPRVDGRASPGSVGRRSLTTRGRVARTRRAATRHTNHEGATTKPNRSRRRPTPHRDSVSACSR